MAKDKGGPLDRVIANKKAAKAAVPAVDDFDELAALAGDVKALEDERRAESGSSNTWIKVLNSGVDEVTKRAKKYVQDAEPGDYYIADKGILLKEPEMTVLGIFKVYAEKKPAPKKEDGADRDEMDQTVSFWHPVDAEQMPLKKGDNFRRELRNGNYLMPMHWMFVYIHGHEEIKDALIPFQSKGNGYCSDIVKLLKKNSSIFTELRLKFKAVDEYNEAWQKTYFYPEVEIVGNNFARDPDTGKITAVKGGMKVDEIREVLQRAKDANEAYASYHAVSKRSEAQLLALAPPLGTTESHSATPRKGLPGSNQGYQDEESAAPAGRQRF